MPSQAITTSSDNRLSCSETACLERAVNLLRANWPEFSSAAPIWKWQRLFCALLLVGLVLGLAVAPRPTLVVTLAALAAPFFCVVLLRAAALWHSGSARTARHDATGPEEQQAESLAPYTVLVPLLREAAVVPDLLKALAAIDYPADRLEILLIVESVDLETHAALARAPLPSHIRIVVVPDGAPRTKPRALNFALAQATGVYVVVYDAEDMPEPDQLRRALNRLEIEPRLGCVQARLNVYNEGATWLTRGIA